MTMAPSNTEHPWVLVEGRGTEAAEAADQLRRLGYEVATCDGPGDHHPCPLVTRDACPLVDCAPLVVNALGDLDADGAIEHATAQRTAVVHVGDPATDPTCLAPPVTSAKLLHAIRTAYRVHGADAG